MFTFASMKFVNFVFFCFPTEILTSRSQSTRKPLATDISDDQNSHGNKLNLWNSRLWHTTWHCTHTPHTHTHIIHHTHTYRPLIFIVYTLFLKTSKQAYSLAKLPLTTPHRMNTTLFRLLDHNYRGQYLHVFTTVASGQRSALSMCLWPRQPLRIHYRYFRKRHFFIKTGLYLYIPQLPISLLSHTTHHTPYKTTPTPNLFMFAFFC